MSRISRISETAIRYRGIRERTGRLAAPLSAEDCCVQSMTDASPVKWHLAHTTWFFETFVLEQAEQSFRPFREAYRVLFNSYYNGIGDKHPRPQRGMLTRPSLEEVMTYRGNVDERLLALLDRDNLPAPLLSMVELGLQHEQQHQELILTDLKHLLSLNPLAPVYAEATLGVGQAPPPPQWVQQEGGVVQVGHDGKGFAFDNELPRHRVFVEPYALADRLITNAEYLAFVLDGGYTTPSLWLAEGWDWVQAQGITKPLYWRQDGQEWFEFTLHGMQSLDPGRPVAHLSFYEADAFARWAGARLPTEAEWESAAAGLPVTGDTMLHPARTGTGSGLQQLFGSCWQWTLSSYTPYPGYAPARGAVGEYNGKFMCNQYVLRGSSCVTPSGHSRTSYRNFFPAYARWQFAGIRLARSL